MKNRELYELQAEVCKCLANPSRLEIISVLRDGELSASELAVKLGISNANMSQHLAMMRDKGILKSRREGVSIHYSLANPRVVEACDIMHEVLVEFINDRRRLARSGG